MIFFFLVSHSEKTNISHWIGQQGKRVFNTHLPLATLPATMLRVFFLLFFFFLLPMLHPKKKWETLLAISFFLFQKRDWKTKGKNIKINKLKMNFSLWSFTFWWYSRHKRSYYSAKLIAVFLTLISLCWRGSLHTHRHRHIVSIDGKKSLKREPPEMEKWGPLRTFFGDRKK